MKKLIITLFIISVSNVVWSQTTSENFIKTTTYQVETQNGSVTNDEKIEVITYHDGLGRAKQTISKQIGGNKEDNITPIIYDAYGRQNIEYLPYSRSSSSLNYEDPITSGLFSNLNNQYLANHPEDFNSSAIPNPYAQTVLENSPLSRIKEKAAAGYDWRYDENNISSIDINVPIPLNFSTTVDPLLFPDPNSNADALGQVDISVSNTEINIAFEMIMQQSELNVGQIVYLDTAPYTLEDYFIGQLTDDTGTLIPYFVQIQNNYLVITSTDPTYIVSGLYCTLNLIVNIPPAEFTTYQEEISSNNTIRYKYGTNSLGNDIKHFGVEFIGNTQETELVYIDNYPPYSLYKTIIRDENWQPNPDPSITEKNNTTEEYKDKFGRIVLKRTFDNNEPHDTYYVYDKYGNLAYVIPPLATDEILVMGNQGFRVASQINYSWIDLVEVDKNFAEDYKKRLKDYTNEDLLNADIENEYGGQGGFSISTFENTDLVTLSLSFANTKGLSLKQGELASLKKYGRFKDVELGSIMGDDFDYFFLIKNNAIVIEKRGRAGGELTSINETFNNIELNYSQDYLWTTYSEVDAKFASRFEERVRSIAKETNQSILNTFVENEYGARGGLNISIDNNDIITININSSSDIPLKLKQGLIIPLNTRQPMEDRELGSISGAGYDYYFAIRQNSLFVNGYGLVTNLNASFTSPPPPETPTIMPGTVGGLCFIYHYDYRNRVMHKKIPGKGWQYLVYDKLDRPILTQDAKMRLNNQWLFTKYDIFGREIYTGIYTYNPIGSEANEQLELQNIIDNQNTPNWFENKLSIAQTISGSTIYYSNNSYPTANIDIQTINYYDDYNFDNTEIALTLPTSIFGQEVSNQVKTLNTGSKIRVLGTDQWITSLTYYDDKSRPIYLTNKNEYFNSLNTTKINLDFIGNILVKEMSHSKDTNPVISTIDNYTYDHTGRLLTQNQTINGSLPELITSNTYNGHGQLMNKKVGGSVTPVPENSVGLQTVDYTYNIRGWLKAINNGETLAGDLFGFKISYNTPEHSGVPSLYNGNISETYWKTSNDNNLRSYDYRYDALNRIKTANYHGDYTLVNSPGDTEDYSLGNVDYDKNGNIIALNRTGFQDPAYGNSGIGIIDDLTYAYESLSNKLTSINDLATKDGFNNQNISDNDYGYDINGNLIIDKNKKIVNIEYNHLNLPQKIEFDFDENSNHLDHGTIEYVYDAKGIKLSKNVLKSGILTRWAPQLTLYVDNFIYKGYFDADATLNFINHPEGYIEPNEIGNYNYVYQFKDHLKNVRITYSDDNNSNSVDASEIRREQNYYPFGLQHKGYNNVINGTENNYQTYQGQEEEKDLNINMYGFQWRDYDPAIARFNKIDRFAEKYYDQSPYHFTKNNPILYAEVKGDSLKVSFRTGFLGIFGKKVTLNYDDVNQRWNDSNGKEYTGKTSNFADKVLGDLKKNQENLLGNEIVSNLANDNHSRFIKRGSPNNNKTTNHNIYYSSVGDDGQKIFQNGGSGSSPGYVVLGHEMAHKYSRSLGVRNVPWFSSDGQQRGVDEYNAMYYENVLRDANGLSLRTGYTETNGVLQGTILDSSGALQSPPTLLSTQSAPTMPAVHAVLVINQFLNRW